MEDYDRQLIQRLRETNDEPSRVLAKVMEKAYDSPEEILKVLDELRPVLGEQSFTTIEEMLDAGRRIARGLLESRDLHPGPPGPPPGKRNQ